MHEINKHAGCKQSKNLTFMVMKIKKLDYLLFKSLNACMSILIDNKIYFSFGFSNIYFCHKCFSNVLDKYDMKMFLLKKIKIIF